VSGKIICVSMRRTFDIPQNRSCERQRRGATTWFIVLGFEGGPKVQSIYSRRSRRGGLYSLVRRRPRPCPTLLLRLTSRKIGRGRCPFISMTSHCTPESDSLAFSFSQQETFRFMHGIQGWAALVKDKNMLTFVRPLACRYYHVHIISMFKQRTAQPSTRSLDWEATTRIWRRRPWIGLSKR
jgi:hypothetical protein